MLRRVLIALVALTALSLSALAIDKTGLTPVAPDAGSEPVVVLQTVKGDIYLRFFPELAPEHVKNFLFHCEEGNYTDTYFHRVIPGFMIQGGDFNTKNDDPRDDGTGGYSYLGPGTNLKAEFSDRKHKRGILSMARGGHSIDSAGSQFFLMHRDYPSLNGKYTVFGEVLKGLDVIDAIVGVETYGRNGHPSENQTITGVEILSWPTAKVETYLYEQKTIEQKSKVLPLVR